MTANVSPSSDGKLQALHGISFPWILSLQRLSRPVENVLEKEFMYSSIAWWTSSHCAVPCRHANMPAFSIVMFVMFRHERG